MKEVLDSFPLWKRLVLISKVNKVLSARLLAREIKDLETNSYFREVLKFIEEKGFCKVDKTCYPAVYKIKNTELAEFLRDGEPFKLAEDLIKLTCKIYNY